MISEKNYSEIKIARAKDDYIYRKKLSYKKTLTITVNEIITATTIISFLYIAVLTLFRSYLYLWCILPFLKKNTSVINILNFNTLPPEGYGIIAFFTLLSIALGFMLCAITMIYRFLDIKNILFNLVRNIFNLKINTEHEYKIQIIFLLIFVFTIIYIVQIRIFTVCTLIASIAFISIFFAKKIMTIFTIFTSFTLLITTISLTYVSTKKSSNKINKILNEGIQTTNSTCTIKNTDRNELVYIISKAPDGFLVMDINKKLKMIPSTDIKEIVF